MSSYHLTIKEDNLREFTRARFYEVRPDDPKRPSTRFAGSLIMPAQLWEIFKGGLCVAFEDSPTPITIDFERGETLP